MTLVSDSLLLSNLLSNPPQPPTACILTRVKFSPISLVAPVDENFYPQYIIYIYIVDVATFTILAKIQSGKIFIVTMTSQCV